MFGKKFLKDKDLEFLEECSNEDLKVLADLLVYDKDNNPRYSETLSRTRLYKSHTLANYESMDRDCT